MAQRSIDFPPACAAAGDGELDAIPRLGAGARVALDLETTGLGAGACVAGVSVAWRDGGRLESRYLPCGHPEGRQHDSGAVRKWCRDVVAGSHVVFRNAKQDLAWLRGFGVDAEAAGCQPHEVQHAAALLDDRRRDFSLDALALDRLGEGKLGVRLPAVGLLPAWEAAPYARRDAELTLRLDESYAPDVAAQGLGGVLALEDSLIWCVAHMERGRTPIDAPKLARWAVEVEQARIAHVLQLHRLTGLLVNPNSGRDMGHLFSHLGLHAAARFDQEALEEHSGSPAVALALEARQLASVLSKYLVKYGAALDGDGMLPYQLHQLRADDGGTITGRFASSRVNIQQVMKTSKQAPVTRRWPVRELFVAPPGRLFLDADASQIEFRLFAHYSCVPAPGSRRLIDAYNDDSGLDFHQLVTDDILGGIMSRDLAKNWSFRKLYGGGIAKSMLMTGLDEDSCRRMDREYDELFPEARRLLWFCADAAKRRGYVKTMLGRRRRFQPGDRYYAALNCVLQGGAADIMKLKLKRLYDERNTTGFNPRFTVHDEVCGDIDPDPAALARTRECLAAQEWPLRVPITWNASVGINWKEAM